MLKPSIVDQFVADTGCQVFVDTFDQPWVEVADGGAKWTYPVNSPEFRSRVTYWQFQKTRQTPSKAEVEQVVRALDSLRWDPTTPGDVTVSRRVAADGAAFYLDLGDRQRRAVRVTSDGWQVVTDYPVHFHFARGMRPLPEPVKGGDVSELEAFLPPCLDAHDRLLLVGWVLAALNPVVQYPAACLLGPAGSGKSTLSGLLRDLVDPHASQECGLPEGEVDLGTAAANSHVLAYGNIGGMASRMSDALCRVSTGGGIRGRKLYDQGVEAMFNFRCPLILNGLTQFVPKNDLNSRCLTVELRRMAADERRTTTALLARFEAARPRLLGALLDLMAGGLRSDAPVTSLPRLAGASEWVERCLRAGDFQEGAFVAAVERVQTAEDAKRFSSWVVWSFLDQLVTDRIKCSPTELHNCWARRPSRPRPSCATTGRRTRRSSGVS